MRKPLMAGNWKMNGTGASAKEFIDALAIDPAVAGKRQALVCAPFTLLPFLKTYALANRPELEVGAENVHPEPKGAYTGEISVEMLWDCGCTFCIVGHSERREYFGETDRFVNGKMNALLAGGITPIVCVGETLGQREAGETRKVVQAQVAGSIHASANDMDLSSIVVAYEPVWAIGTGKTATSEQAQEVCSFIRELLGAKLGTATADGIRILYGGSMNTKNVDELMSMPDIDGGLVGGASLKAADFSRLIAYIEK